METNKENKYIDVKNKIQEFWETYNNNNYGLSMMARYTIVSAALKTEFSNFNFIGFYVVKVVNNDKILEIGPYQSDILATAHIEYGKGVCGTCWKEEKTIIENDVSQCKNYIACDDVTKAEICVPVIQNNKMIALLDIDSIIKNDFDEIDKKYLSEIIGFLVK